MLRIRLLTLAGCAIVLSALWAQAQESDIKAVVQKAIAAHGGEKLLLKYHAGTSKFKGTMELMNMKVPISGEAFFQKPNKMKNTITMELNNQNITLTQVFDGKTFWVNILGKTKEIKDEKVLKEVRESQQAEGAGSLVAILNKPYELAPLGVVKVKGQDAVGVRVTKMGHRDYSLFFDKKTGLLAKMEARGTDPMSGQEVTQEKFFSEYKDQKGLKTPGRLTIHKDGNFFMEMEITDGQPLEKLDDATFAMP